MNADAIVIICDDGATPPSELVGIVPTTCVIGFDDVDHDDISCGRPIHEADARLIAETITMAKTACVVTCRGGVSRSAAVSAAAVMAGLAEPVDTPFGPNAIGTFTCPNRLVFDTYARAWGHVDTTVVDGLFERNVREHLAANA